MKAKTGCDRLLELLMDGKRHSYREAYSLGLMVHSRAADLRKRGYDVVCTREGDEYWYELRLGQMELEIAS